ncbi:MAG TPA: hypothetical protein VNR61_16345 [Niallia sp.]|nr:hypothetical protein [Niallia sp.]
MKRIKTIIIVFFSFLIYSMIVYYNGWNGYVLLRALDVISYPGIYILFIIFLAYSYILSHFTSFTIFKIVGSYWLAILEYSILLFPIANLFWLLLNQWITDATIWIGMVTLSIILIILLYGTFNAYFPIIRTYQLSVEKRIAKRDSLTIAVASDMHFGTIIW